LVLKPEDFAFEFPPGTQVVEYGSKQGDVSHFIAQSDGKKRIITLDEFKHNASYEQLLASESGQAGVALTPVWRRVMPTLLFVLIIVAVALSAFIKLRRNAGRAGKT
jgi:hypothetical protein